MIVIASRPSNIALHDCGVHGIYRVEVSAFTRGGCKIFGSPFKPPVSAQSAPFTFSFHGQNVTNGQVVYKDKVNHLIISAAEDADVIEYDGYTSEIVLEPTPAESRVPAIGLASYTQIN